jgi:DnaK suppressor protein
MFLRDFYENERKIMNTSKYKQILLAKEHQLSARLERAGEATHEQIDAQVQDLGDEAVTDEERDVQFQEADADWTVLQQVRAALKRIDDGDYGKCMVDGAPIEEKRLEAVPWAPYCIKHQELLEKSAPPQTPTL